MNRIIAILMIGIVMAPATTCLWGDDGNASELLKRFADEFVSITPGQGKFPATFQMGDANEKDQPVRRVRIDRAFHIAKYEVTQELWHAVMGKNPSRWKGERNSVEMLSHDEAVEFCRRVTKRLASMKLINADEVIRLPSEAEWEYCARAGTKTKYSFGDNVSDLNAYAWHTGNAAGNDPPVGAKKPNPWGLYDMHGYLWEWCSDPWLDRRTSAPDSKPDQKKRVIRSGSWKDAAPKLTSSFRIGVVSKTKDDAIGFRCVQATKTTGGLKNNLAR
ncbi:formylglycine-generating enzyme family protein [Planctomycetota bacterium]